MHKIRNADNFETDNARRLNWDMTYWLGVDQLC